MWLWIGAVFLFMAPFIFLGVSLYFGSLVKGDFLEYITKTFLSDVWWGLLGILVGISSNVGYYIIRAALEY